MTAQQGLADGASFDTHVVIRIIDTGKGVPEESRERLFYPFYTTKQSGSGVGLPLAKKIVERHGGFMDFESTPGEGTTFVVRLPLVEPPAPFDPSRAKPERRAR